ncbi:MAG: hypothetical protein ACI94Y_001776 [Maribacter sp.]|jgi:uncharacterized protein YqjF (DUF2071 family)
MQPFLTAEWKNLILLTYAVDPLALELYLPDGLELDLYKGKAFVSFVAFEFLNTRVKGIPIPFHMNFPEVNLRFYVRHMDKDGNSRRGVVFIKELVPKHMIALVANKVYNEPYYAIPMKGKSVLKEGKWIMDYEMMMGGQKHSWKFIAENTPYTPAEGSTEHFFKEHEWGFGTNHKGQLMHYQVEHPVWRIYPLEKRFGLKVDFGVLYGENWSFLNLQIPYNIMVAEGSPIKVFPGSVVGS